ncbi:hypothetical protein T02_14212 [Trichinella nativa]|uniref:Uncharacterized protein n=1 Tax=Trichinella nativa TaxID=6335 RepID=A0A0V1LCX3_9BILA|nr:hypothetical protein T02_14212 [Trichinella nativa]
MFNSWCDEENRNWINLFNSHAQIESNEIELSFSCCLRRRLQTISKPDSLVNNEQFRDMKI